MGNPLMDRTVRQGVSDSRHMIPQGHQSGPASYQPGAPSAQQLDQQFQMPAYQAAPAQPERAMTYDDVFMKSLACFGILLVGAAVGWFIPQLMLVGAIVGLVLGLVNAFKKEPSKGLILGYAVFEGMFLGGISKLFESLYGGIVVQAVLATLSVFAVMFCLFKFAKVRMSGGFLKFLMIAVGGYAVFSIVNFFFSIFSGGAMNARSVQISIMGIDMPLGVIIGLVATVLAAMTLVSDFQMIEQGVVNRIPEKYSWLCAFSLMTTLVWLYVEILRLLSYLRGND
jgi:uncharacterized YccA/Bax inhibitor family protein